MKNYTEITRRLVEKLGQVKTAQEMGCTQPAICRRLRGSSMMVEDYFRLLEVAKKHRIKLKD